MARVQQLSQVVFQLVMREPGHRDRLVPAGQRQTEHPRRQLRIIVKQLIEVSHAEQEQHARMALLGIPILLHHGGQRHSDQWLVVSGQ